MLIERPNVSFSLMGKVITYDIAYTTVITNLKRAQAKKGVNIE